MGRNPDLTEYYTGEYQKALSKDISTISKAVQIEGWMDISELLWLAEQAKTHWRIAEIGCYLGRSTRALADNTPGRVFAIDDWYGPRETDINNRESLHSNFSSNLKDLIEIKRVRPIKCNHRLIPRGIIKPDMTFIDGDHSFAATYQDIEFWSRELKESGGGLICGHDADIFTVKNAVLDVLGELQIVPETKIWRFEIR